MMLVKPDKDIPTVYVTVTDKATKRSKGITIYSTTPEQVIEQIKRLVAADRPVARKAAS